MAQFGPLECFMVVPVEEQEAWLRRFSHGDDEDKSVRCPMTFGSGAHSAAVHIGRIPLEYEDRDGHRMIKSTPPEDYEGDERWPTHCGCGYEFTDDDTRQVLGRQLWERVAFDGEPVPGALGKATGERRIIDAVHSDQAGIEPWGPGAMYDSWWLADMPSYRGPDGLALTVTLPDGRPWIIDGPPGWTRTGTPPKVTVTPSVSSKSGEGEEARETWHGWLRDGVLVSV